MAESFENLFLFIRLSRKRAPPKTTEGHPADNGQERQRMGSASTGTGAREFNRREKFKAWMTWIRAVSRKPRRFVLSKTEARLPHICNQRHLGNRSPLAGSWVICFQPYSEIEHRYMSSRS